MSEKEIPVEEQNIRSKFRKYEDLDPFQDIPCSLLNSADIIDYVSATGMIFPFYENQMKPASYAVALLGEYVYWDEKGEKKEGKLERGKYITVKKDSMIFFTLEPLLQLPSYIAARFNLKIDNVYKGLLLGTGPLVDPGFVGRLSFPVHNFTSNDYIFRGGETFIWLEFTKVSPNKRWHTGVNSGEQRRAIPKSFNPKKKDRTLEDYLVDADKRPIQSSIPLSIGKSEQAAKKASNSVRIMGAFNIAIVLTALGVFATVLYQTNTFYNTAKTEVINNQNKFQDGIDVTIKDLNNRIDSLNKEIEKIKN